MEDNKGKIRTGRAIASFLFPIVGAVTVAQHMETDKAKAKGYGLITVFSIVLMIIGAILYRMNRPSPEEIQAQKEREEREAELQRQERERQEQAFQEQKQQYLNSFQNAPPRTGIKVFTGNEVMDSIIN